jgi:hypothetical protein
MTSVSRHGSARRRKLPLLEIASTLGSVANVDRMLGICSANRLRAP